MCFKYLETDILTFCLPKRTGMINSEHVLTFQAKSFFVYL